jgi:hypothetical protein
LAGWLFTRYGAGACAADQAGRHKKKAYGHSISLLSSHFLIMNQNETACSAKVSNPCASVINTENTDTRTRKPTLYVRSEFEEIEIEAAVNFLKDKGWYWEPVDPARWGLFPGYEKSDRSFK